MTATRGEPLLDRFALHYGIDTSIFPAGNFSWQMTPPAGDDLTDLPDDTPPFRHTGAADRGHWQTTFEFGNGAEKVTVVANSRLVLTQISGKTVPVTLITGAQGRQLTTIVSHPVLEGLVIDDIEMTDDLCSIVCLR